MSIGHQIDQLRRQIALNAPAYLLVDPILGDIATAPDRASYWGRPIHVIDLPFPNPIGEDQRPYLVGLEGIDDPWLALSLEMAQEACQQSWKDGLAGAGRSAWPVGGWIQTTLPPSSLARQLGVWCQLKTKSFTTARYLRLCDSRVLDLCRHIFGNSTLSALLGRVSHWNYLDAQGQLCTLSAHAATERSTAEPANWHWSPTSWPEFDHASWKALQSGLLIHPAMARAYGQRLMDGSNEAFDREHVRAWIAAAATARPPAHLSAHWQTDEDQITALALDLLHPGWQTHHQVQAWLTAQSPRTSEASLHELGPELHAHLVALMAGATAA